MLMSILSDRDNLIVLKWWRILGEVVYGGGVSLESIKRALISIDQEIYIDAVC